ncbi:NAD(P)-binding protein [Venturia nashicola]|uniref:NAD(P)-binding protein n=1 Tax=Venturia nashicola TaxID=86259 RepID=A0A4Z1PPI3_9PEZI|nr:NAD(P)-binding protein [Venturia nashicola]TLD37093.1 NAD(P)-binding protein [Venturia nashicola]
MSSSYRVKQDLGKERKVLITGCSDGGLGAALAIALHKFGLHVYATGRNTANMATLTALGIETLTLDVQSTESINACVAEIGSRKGGLDILINNAGANYPMSFSDMSVPKAKQIFDLNVWSYLEVTQAFLPLLLQSKGMVVNHTSIASVCTDPFQSTYNASKAAMAMFSDHQRLELAPFGIKVIDLKTGAVVSNISQNAAAAQKLPESSMYVPARGPIERWLAGADMKKKSMDTTVWAECVVPQLIKKRPSSNIWAGGNASKARFKQILPHGIRDSKLKKKTGLTQLETALNKDKVR